MVIATQNPVEHHGTYPLPESQLDRFLMRLRIGYPDAASEREIVRNSQPRLPQRSRRPDLVAEDVLQLQDAVHARRGGRDAGRLHARHRREDAQPRIAGPRRQPARLPGALPRRAGPGAARRPRLRHPRRREAAGRAAFAHRVVINTRTTLVQRRADVGERIIEEILSQVEVPL